jgi:hypothetical protein
MNKLLIILLFLSSCATQRNAEKFVDKQKGVEWLADKCSKEFQIMETSDTLIQSDTALLAAYEQEYAYLNYLLDSLLSKGSDTVLIDKIRERIKVKEVPTVKTITVVKENIAKIAAVQFNCDRLVDKLNATIEKQSKQIDGAEVKIESLESKVKKARSNNLYLWLVIISLTLFTFRKPILKLIK